VNLEKFIAFVTSHNEAIIQWLFLGILLLAGSLIARSLFGKKDEEPAVATEAAGGTDLQSALEKILAQTTKLESISLDKLSPQGVAEVDAQVQALKADLAAREVELSQLKSAGGAGGESGGGGNGSQNSEEAAALSARVKELESKLSEYEILEDDIADLSLYKEENARLKTEIDRIKGGGAASAEAAPAADGTAEQAPAGEDIVAEFAHAVGQESDLPPAADGPTMEIPDTGDPMADFESTVQLEKQLAGDAPASTPAPVAEPASAAQPAASAQAEADDLFAEFSAAAPEEEQDSATLDTEKMMAEMAALVGMEPSESALEEGIDTEKMAAEATTLPKS